METVKKNDTVVPPEANAVEAPRGNAALPALRFCGGRPMKQPKAVLVFLDPISYNLGAFDLAVLC
jgi:hypothetical protein